EPSTESAAPLEPTMNSTPDTAAVEITAVTQQQAPSDVTAEPEIGAAAEPESYAGAELDDESTAQAASAVAAAIETTAGTEPANESGEQPGSGTESEAATVAQPAAPGQAAFVSEPGTASDTDAVIVKQPQPVAPGGIESNQQRFDLLLRQSMAWINDRDDVTGTIQILLLGYNSFNVDNFYDYVSRLADRQVDVGKLRVFKASTGKAEVYGVFYGEYASRRAAFSAINELPAVLRDASPIPRSVGGLWQEIRRLESKI
ncbi:MAG: hypothetical protein OEN02_00670, partial [Gammaproteobacteria bacterium]|nr:hypothetical protein [Gammaproteobacteria bacterium]